MKVAFVCDSGTGRNVAQLKKMGIYSCPLQISDDQNNYLELEDKEISEIYELVEQKQPLKTSLPPLGKINETIEAIKNEGYDTMFCVPICSGLSGTANAFRLACEDAGLTFIFVDTHVTAEVEFYCITQAKKMYDEGKPMDEILSALKDVIDSASTILMPMDLQHLVRGGRLTPMAATLAGFLKIQPILKIDQSTNGKIDVFDKVRTLPKAMERVLDFMEAQGVGKGYNIYVAYVKETGNCEGMLEKIRERFPCANASLIPLISTVGCHTGIGCIAVQYYKRIGE